MQASLTLYGVLFLAVAVFMLWVWRTQPHQRASHTVRWLRVQLTRQTRKAFRALSKAQVWLLGGGLWLVVGAYLVYLSLAHDLLALAFTTVLFFMAVSLLTLSVLFSLPLFLAAWRSAPSRLLIAVVPGFLLFVTKLHANVQVTDLLSVTSSVAPTAVWLGAIYLLCLVMGVVLVLVAMCFGLLLVPLWGRDTLARVQVYFQPAHRVKTWGWLVLIAGIAASAGVSNAILMRWLTHASPATLLAAVYAFDAAPGTFCSLPEVQRNDPYRVLHLPSLEQRAMLVRAEPALEAPVRFWHLGTANSPGAGPWLTVLGASDCFSTTQSPASVPARPAAP